MKARNKELKSKLKNEKTIFNNDLIKVNLNREMIIPKFY